MYVALLGAIAALTAHNAWAVLPVYALCMTAASGEAVAGAADFLQREET